MVDRLDADDVRIVDTRWYLSDPLQGRHEYAAAHVPGALFFDLSTDLAAEEGPGRHPLPHRADFAETLGNAGIANNHHVIVYDHGPGTIAARLWWLLRWVGHAAVSVLDGGFAAWKSDGFATSASIPAHPPVTFDLAASLTQTVDRNSLRSRLGTVPIVDARAGARYRGESEPVDSVAGHIPTALSAPTDGNNDDSGRFKSPDELATRFIDLGIDPSQQIVNSCGSGVTACHNILAQHIAGFPEPVLYPGSWSDWSSSGYPVATGAEPGQTLPGQ